MNADVLKARLDDPQGYMCSACGNENDWADDCGWFYFYWQKPWHKKIATNKPVCKRCWYALGLTTCER